MRFLTWANDPSDPRCELLFASARHFGIEVEPIGVGKEYRGGVSKIEWLADALKGSDDLEPYTVCVDAFDCLFLRDPYHGMYEMFDFFDTSTVYAGERWYRNRPPLLKDGFIRRCSTEWYEDDENGPYPNCTMYPYPNAGCVMGWEDSLAALYSSLDNESRGSLETREQWFVANACKGFSTIEIDYECRLFYCCGGEWRRFAGEVVDGRFRNKRTDTYPYILHAPMPRRSLPIRERIAKELGII